MAIRKLLLLLLFLKTPSKSGEFLALFEINIFQAPNLAKVCPPKIKTLHEVFLCL